MDSRNIVLNYPGKIWLGQDEKINIQILIPESNQQSDNSNQNQASSNKIENDFIIDLALNGAKVDPPGKLITPVVPNKDYYLTKKIEAQYPEKIKGTLWIFISQSGQSDEFSSDHRLIFSKEIEINTRNMIGMSFQILRWTGLFGLVICLLFLFRYSKINHKFQKDQMLNS